ncbi:uncharacterized protein G2W53_036217 [Senna tora]|uniref:Uncharacterized protein n=1 Tax=Senna tora TaxID=362788 RepID=A0A834T4L8_9FABA|nr:uncharacterized protein G2W53_036217 [Senna tora]
MAVLYCVRKKNRKRQYHLHYRWIHGLYVKGSREDFENVVVAYTCRDSSVGGLHFLSLHGMGLLGRIGEGVSSLRSLR